MLYSQPPPAYYTVYPRAVEAQQPANPQANRNANTNNTASSSKTRENLITKFNLQTRVASPPPTVSSPSEGTSTALENINAAQHKWEDTPEKREASLRERKARMVLAAREYVNSLTEHRLRERADVHDLTDAYLRSKRRRHRPLRRNPVASLSGLFEYFAGSSCRTL